MERSPRVGDLQQGTHSNRGGANAIRQETAQRVGDEGVARTHAPFQTIVARPDAALQLDEIIEILLPRTALMIQAARMPRFRAMGHD